MGISPFDPSIKTAVEKGLLPASEVKAVKKAVIAKAKGKSKKSVATGDKPRWVLTLYPACRVISEANRREHWAVANARKLEQKEAVRRVVQFGPFDLRNMAIPTHGSPPCVVTLTHIGPTMDDDNLRRAFKGVRDELAKLLGVDDGDARVKWEYEQRVGKAGIRIDITSGE